MMFFPFININGSKETKNILPDDANILKNEEDLASGVSLENASYFENNLNQDQVQDNETEKPEEVVIEDISIYEEKSKDVNGIKIRIEDNGKGIPKKDWKNIFRPGFSTKQTGWGLGLSLSSRIVEEIHEGSLKGIRSSLNTGTILEISL